jgi:hypothetical protein
MFSFISLDERVSTEGNEIRRSVSWQHAALNGGHYSDLKPVFHHAGSFAR